MSSIQMLQTIVKNKVNNMPDNISDEKDILEYVKTAIKEGKAELKKKGSKKKNNENKPKYSLSSYQEYMKENLVIFKDKYPELSSKERLVKIAEEWNKYKETDEYKELCNKKKDILNKVEVDEDNSNDDDVSDTNEVIEDNKIIENKNEVEPIANVAVKKKKPVKK